MKSKEDSRKKYLKQYRLDNRDKIAELQKQYYLDNIDKLKQSNKQYRLGNRDKIKQSNKQYNLKNKDKIKQSNKQYHSDNKYELNERSKKYWIENENKLKQYHKQYRLDNKKQIKHWKLNHKGERRVSDRKYYHQRKSEPLYNLKNRLRNRTGQIIRRKNFSKSKTFYDYIGCTGEELYKYIESQFTEGMSWDLMGTIHIDHKIPLASAKTEEEVYKLCHYTNLQPLWAKDNLIKGCKY